MRIMEDSDDDNSNQFTELDKKTRDKILENEMRSFRNRGFHDGYDEGKQAVIQKSFDNGYKKAFEQNFILSTLRGVVQALLASHNLNSTSKTTTTNRSSSSATTSTTTSRPTSTTSSASTSSPCPPTRHRSIINRGSKLFGSSVTTASGDICSSSSSSSSNISNTTTGTSNINISSNHLSMLESMNFDNANDIESIKKDLIQICRENRLEILAHYVSEIG